MSTFFINLNKNKDYLEDYLTYLKRFLFKASKTDEEVPKELSAKSDAFFESGMKLLKAKDYAGLLALVLGQTEFGTFFKKKNRDVISSLLYILSGLCRRIEGFEH